VTERGAPETQLTGFGFDVMDRLARAVERLAGAIERQSEGLGPAAKPRYSRPPTELATEPEMAAILHISGRTLARHRRDGRLPGCWIRNGGRVVWRVAETQAAWERGIA
jgi:hypothetical protein